MPTPASESRNNAGINAARANRLTDAVALFTESLLLDPENLQARFNLATTFAQQGLLDNAAAEYTIVLSRNPNLAEAHNNLGNIRKAQQRLDEATDCFRRAIEIKPDFTPAHYNLASALKDQGQLDDAIASCDRVLRLPHEGIPVRWNRALTLLTRGDYLEGWREYAAHNTDLQKPRPDLANLPHWTGQDISTQSILLRCTGGLGDTLLFSRYIPLVSQRAAQVILESPPPLTRLLKSSLPANTTIISRGDRIPPSDFQAPLPSLPALFQTTLETIPNTTPYLNAPPDLIEHWLQILSPTNSNLKVGLVWSGSPANTEDHKRSLPLSHFAPLASIPYLTLYSLQVGPASDQICIAPPGLNLINHTSALTDFAETAALIANLGLVITVDTSIAHLAGTLGKPTWLLLAHVPYFLWMLNRNDTPWYPSIKLFRQPKPNDWPTVIQNIANSLPSFNESMPR